MTAGNNINSQ
jgi:hypothetical protein